MAKFSFTQFGNKAPIKMKGFALGQKQTFGRKRAMGGTTYTLQIHVHSHNNVFFQNSFNIKIEYHTFGGTWWQPLLSYGNCIWSVSIKYSFIHLLKLSLTCIFVHSLPL